MVFLSLLPPLHYEDYEDKEEGGSLSPEYKNGRGHHRIEEDE